MTDVILTGISRSGTTLTCHLLNKLPDTVALNEPLKIVAKDETCSDQDVLLGRIDRFFADTRHSLLSNGTAVTKHVDGQVPTNHMGAYARLYQYLPNRFLGKALLGRPIVRSSIVRKGRITFAKPLSDTFTLCIKHNGGFVSMLPTLQAYYPCYAIIRNPLAILASWNSIENSLYEGHIHLVERMNPLLKWELSQIPDRISRQLHILNWFFKQIQQHLPLSNIIRYETLIASHGTALQAVTPCAATLNVPLHSKNRNQLYNHQLMHTLAEALLSQKGAYWHFYSVADVQTLLAPKEDTH